MYIMHSKKNTCIMYYPNTPTWHPFAYDVRQVICYYFNYKQTLLFGKSIKRFSQTFTNFVMDEMRWPFRNLNEFLRIPNEDEEYLWINNENTNKIFEWNCIILKCFSGLWKFINDFGYWISATLHISNPYVCITLRHWKIRDFCKDYTIQ